MCMYENLNFFTQMIDFNNSYNKNLRLKRRYILFQKNEYYKYKCTIIFFFF